MAKKIPMVAALFALLLGFSLSVKASDVTAFTGFTNEGRLSNSTTFGGSLNIDFAKRFSLEQRLALLPKYPQIRGTNPGTWGLSYNTAAALNLPGTSHVAPYVLGGVGFVSALRNDPLNIGTNPDFVYGGGLKVFSGSKRFGLKFEARGHRIPNLIGDRSFNTFEFTAGPVIRLSGE